MKHLKLRWFILVLMVLNALFYVWRTGGFAPWAWAPESAREPERLQQQINPDKLVITRKNT
jgi:hypothetical protein